MYVVTTEKQGRHVYFHIGAWEEEAPCVCVCVYGAFFIGFTKMLQLHYSTLSLKNMFSLCDSVDIF